MVILHKMDQSPPARAALMLIDLLDIDIEFNEMNILAGDQNKPEFLKKNPLHTIPVLEDGDFYLADSHAILTYLVSKYANDEQAKLYPKDLKARAIVDQRLYFDATVLFPRMRIVIFDIAVKSALGPSDEQVANIEECYRYLEIYLEKSSYLAGDHLTVADISCLSSVSNLRHMVPIDKKYTKLNNWVTRLTEEGWYKKWNLPGEEQLVNFIKGLVDRNTGKS